MITLALSKGRIFDETLPLLQEAGIRVLEDPETSRKLILATDDPQVRVVLVRATDVPTYVQYGGADLGVTGLDTLIEHGKIGLYQPLDLQIAKCRMSVATRDDFDYASAVKQGSRIRVATKYTTIARQQTCFEPLRPRCSRTTGLGCRLGNEPGARTERCHIGFADTPRAAVLLAGQHTEAYIAVRRHVVDAQPFGSRMEGEEPFAHNVNVGCPFGAYLTVLGEIRGKPGRWPRRTG